MHILFISSAAEKNIYTGSLDNPEIQQISGLNSPLEYNSQICAIFFDATLGEDNIAQHIQQHYPQDTPPKWFIISFELNIQQSLHFLKTGASGILTAPCSPEKLTKIIHHMANEQPYLDDKLTQALALRQIKKMLTPFNQLSSREFDILCLLSENFSLSYIAKELSISSKTVSNCQTQIRQKLELKNQQDIINFSKSHGLIL